MKLLALYDMAGMTEDEVKAHLAEYYYEDTGEWPHKKQKAEMAETLKDYQILIAAELENSYDGSSWFLLRKKTDDKLYIISGSHCSCFGYEGQGGLEETDIVYLNSDRFHFGVYGDYDERDTVIKPQVKEYIAKLADEQMIRPVKLGYDG